VYNKRVAIVLSEIVGFRARRQLIATSYEPLLPRETRGILSVKPGLPKGPRSGRVSNIVF